MVAEFEADLIRSRTREGDAGSRKRRSAPDKQPKLSKAQEKHLVEVYQRGEHTTAQTAELFSVARSTLYRAIQRAGDTAA
jgi:DNA invertase Pin-like site-specific DNA recombinase